MGIALGLGMLLGVRATTGGNPGLILPMSAGLLLLILLLAARPQVVLLVALAGCLTGALAGTLRHDPAVPSLPVLSGSQFEGRLLTDPRVAGLGVSAQVAWVDDSGVAQRSLVYYPVGTGVGRGDTGRFVGEFAEADPTVFYATTMTRTAHPGRFELLRRELRAEIERRVRADVPGSAGSLALGLLIGDDSALTNVEQGQVRKAGLSHVTAVSGWNVTIVIMTTALVLRALNLYQRRWFVIQVIAIVGFVWLVGIQPPILRAALMGIAALIAFQIGRPAHLLTLLTLSAAIMAALTPSILTSLSFQLSVLSMVGIALAAPLVERLDGAWRVVAAALLVPIAAALMTAPLIAATFGTLSLATIPANIIAAPLVTYGGYAAALTALLADVPVLGVTLGTCVWLSCGGILLIARVASQVSWLHLTFQPLAGSTVVGFYLVLLAILSPLNPEGRALLRSASAWFERSPAAAAAAGASGIAVLIIMLAID